jgi:hypothetical protein
MFLGMSVVNSDIKLKLEPIQEATEILYEKFPHNVDKRALRVMYVSQDSNFSSHYSPTVAEWGNSLRTLNLIILVIFQRISMQMWSFANSLRFCISIT